jgi:ABC-type phosphate/phosphonate transport system substrate-binding protein
MGAAPLVANARMYAVTPAARDLWRRLFEWTADKARIRVAYIDHAAPASLEELWSRDDLGLVFICGYPFAMARPRPQLVAAPVPADPRCGGQAVYWTDLVAAADGPHRSLSDTFGGRIGWTVEHSQSGFNAVRHHLLRYRAGREEPLFRESVGPPVTPRRAVESVLSGTIDVGPSTRICTTSYGASSRRRRRACAPSNRPIRRPCRS